MEMEISKLPEMFFHHFRLSCAFFSRKKNSERRFWKLKYRRTTYSLKQTWLSTTTWFFQKCHWLIDYKGWSSRLKLPGFTSTVGGGFRDELFGLRTFSSTMSKADKTKFWQVYSTILRRRRFFWQNSPVFALTRRIWASQNKKSSGFKLKNWPFLSRIRTFWWKRGLFAKKFTNFSVINERIDKKTEKFVSKPPPLNTVKIP